MQRKRTAVVTLALACAIAAWPGASASALPAGRPAGGVTAQAERWGAPWDRVPTVLIASPAGDPRIPLVLDAVAYWNQQFQNLGTPFRLEPVEHTTQLVPDILLVARGAAIDRGEAPPPIPDGVWLMPGDLIVALSSAAFVSFTTPRAPDGKVLVGIRTERGPPPMGLPNVARNVILHELGHAIGLGHNADATLLMCGRPAACRPDVFQSPVERYFPLADAERILLTTLYPPSWPGVR
jgi:hypothetical protein